MAVMRRYEEVLEKDEEEEEEEKEEEKEDEVEEGGVGGCSCYEYNPRSVNCLVAATAFKPKP